MTKAMDRTELKAQMVAIGEALLETEGLKAVQARTIAAQAGCSVGTIYNVFGNIDELVLIANARTLQHLGGLLGGALEATRHEPLKAQLMALALAYLEFASKHRRRWKAVFEHVMSDNQAVPQWYREAQAPLFGALAAVLPQHLSPEDRRIAAQMLFSAAHGIVTLALDRKLTDEFEREATVRQLDMLVAGAAQQLGG